MNIDQPLSQGVARSREQALNLRNTYDLALLVGLALLLPTALLALPWPLRAPLGLIAGLLAPGYALVAALLPQRRVADGMIRAALSFGLSVATMPMLALLLHHSPWGIKPAPITLALALWLISLAGVALWRRRALLPAGQAYSPPPIQALARWRALAGPTQLRYLVSVCAFGIGALLMVRLVLAADPGPQLTEFYLLGQGGLAEDYPRMATSDQPVSVTVGIANREGAPQRYHVEVWAVDPLAGGHRQRLASSEPLELASGQSREQPISWLMPWAGDDRLVDILLFRNGQDGPYRTLRLWIDVGEFAK